MGLKEIEQKMMDTLSTYAKIQAVQGLIMALMPNQAAVLVGFDKGKREREFFFFNRNVYDLRSNDDKRTRFKSCCTCDISSWVAVYRNGYAVFLWCTL